MAQKVGEEGVEVALAAGDAKRLTEESADLLYQVMFHFTDPTTKARLLPEAES
jgi:phosphoribosyl-ATP pyrophosphohydrolase